MPSHTIPGPCAAIAALTLAGLPTDRFLFLGFLPAKAKARADAIAEVAGVRATLVFYEGGPRLADTLARACRATWDARRRSRARDHQASRGMRHRHSWPSLPTRYADAAPKGEIVIVVGPPAERRSRAMTTRLRARRALARLRPRARQRRSPSSSSVPRKRAYARALETRRAAEPTAAPPSSAAAAPRPSPAGICGFTAGESSPAGPGCRAARSTWSPGAGACSRSSK